MTSDYRPEKTRHLWDRSLDRDFQIVPAPLHTYEIAHFARDDYPRFLELVSYLSPRDQEIMLLFALLQKRPTDLSIIFGKAGHRAEEDLHKAAHKLAGLAEFGALPPLERIGQILERCKLQKFGTHSFAACIWRYANCRNFADMARLIGARGLRQHMLRAFKTLHASEGREEGLLAGWILWLVDGSEPNGKGWRKRRNSGRLYRLGPLQFRASDEVNPRADGRGGQRMRPDVVKITRTMKFALRGMNV